MAYQFDFGAVFDYSGLLAQGAGFTLALTAAGAVLGGAMHLPKATHIDRRLVLGSLTFGAGWGLAGFCPGPGVVSMAGGEPKARVTGGAQGEQARRQAVYLEQRLTGELVFADGHNRPLH